MPSFPSQNGELIKYILGNFVYSKQKEYQFSFQLQFVIDSDGRVIAERIRNKTNLELTLAEKELVNSIKICQIGVLGDVIGLKVLVLITLPLTAHLRE